MALSTFTPVAGGGGVVLGSGRERATALPVVRPPGDDSKLPSTAATAALPVVHLPEHTPPPVEAEVSLALAVVQRPCGDRFRQMILAYDGVAEFGAEAAQRLSGELLASRPDCVAEGWDPEFAVSDFICSSADGDTGAHPDFLP